MGIDDHTLRKKVETFLKDTRNSHYLDEFIRILLNPDTLKVADPPFRENSFYNSPSQSYEVVMVKVGPTIPLPGSDPSKRSGFIKGQIKPSKSSSYTYSFSSVDYKAFRVSQTDSGKDNMVSSLRMIIEPKKELPISFILEFTYPADTKARTFSFKICDSNFYGVHSRPLEFSVGKAKKQRSGHTFPRDKCREKSVDAATTNTYTFKSKEEIDSIIASLF